MVERWRQILFEASKHTITLKQRSEYTSKERERENIHAEIEDPSFVNVSREPTTVKPWTKFNIYNTFRISLDSARLGCGCGSLPKG